MPLGMKHWIGLTLAGLALIVAWQLPPASLEPPSQEVVSAERVRYRALEDEVRNTIELLRQVSWSDSLSRAVLADANDGPAVLTPYVNDAVEGMRLRLRQKVGMELRRLGPREDVAFGYVVQPFDHGSQPDRGAPASPRIETYVGVSDGQAYCLQVRVADSERVRGILANELTDTDRLSPRRGALGPCHFYVRYGMPGERLQGWLERGGIDFGDEAESPPARSGVRSVSRSNRWFTGYAYMSSRRRPIEADQCLAGSATACAILFENPAMANPILEQQLEMVALSPATSLGAPSTVRSILRDGEFLLSDLENEFGTEAFRSFWTSDRDFSTAFSSAFGVAPGDWLVSWLEASVGIEEPGPALPRSASGGSMLALAALLGIAYARNRERRVG